MEQYTQDRRCGLYDTEAERRAETCLRLVVRCWLKERSARVEGSITF